MATAASSNAVRTYDADFKKNPGTLSLTPTTIAWNPKNAGQGDRQQQNLNRVLAMFASKATSPNVSLKVTFINDVPAGGLTFAFTAKPRDQAEAQRTAVQDYLIPFITANRAAQSGGTPSAAPASAPNPASPASASASTPAASSPAPGTPGGSGAPVRKRKAEAPGASLTPLERKIRRRVLDKNPNLKLLHKELVIGKQIEEDEFWDGREALLRAEEMEYEQRPGRQSRLLDDRFDLTGNKKGATAAGGTGIGVKKVDSGPTVLNITKELTREIFEEFPVVQDAYARYVPGISEGEFWQRYFTSQLWEQHRASVRKSATDTGTKGKDDIFDQYLEEPDWDVTPRHQDDGNVERFLDLAATEEDHGESITVRDHTMQAGRERASLPLIRRFNDHSRKLLQSGKQSAIGKSKLSNTILPDDIDIYNEIDIEDLHGPAAPSTIALDVRDEETTTTSRQDRPDRGVIPGKTPQELATIIDREAFEMRTWTTDLASVSLVPPQGGWHQNQVESGGSVEQSEAYQQYALQRDSQAAAMQVIKELHYASNAETATRAPLPEDVLQQMRSCHNAATEFLRQYYSSILPSTAAGNPSSAAIAAKNARAKKMAEYLRTTEQKVNAVVSTAIMAGVDEGRVRAAMAPTVGAVRIALKREEKRLGKQVNGVKGQ